MARHPNTDARIAGRSGSCGRSVLEISTPSCAAGVRTAFQPGPAGLIYIAPIESRAKLRERQKGVELDPPEKMGKVKILFDTLGKPKNKR